MAGGGRKGDERCHAAEFWPARHGSDGALHAYTAIYPQDVAWREGECDGALRRQRRGRVARRPGARCGGLARRKNPTRRLAGWPSLESVAPAPCLPTITTATTPPRPTFLPPTPASSGWPPRSPHCLRSCFTTSSRSSTSTRERGRTDVGASTRALTAYRVPQAAARRLSLSGPARELRC